MKLYGPYVRPDGRSHMVSVDNNGRKTTISYPKFIMEQHLGRRLLTTEVVHHIDRDFTNNNINNLEIIDRSNHTKLHRKEYPRKYIVFVCQECGKKATRDLRRITDNIKQNKKGPFCSRQCAGKWSQKQQLTSKPLKHGTNNCYKYHKCRCVLCKKAHAVVCQAQYQRRHTISKRCLGDGKEYISTLKCSA